MGGYGITKHGVELVEILATADYENMSENQEAYYQEIENARSNYQNSPLVSDSYKEARAYLDSEDYDPKNTILNHQYSNTIRDQEIAWWLESPEGQVTRAGVELAGYLVPVAGAVTKTEFSFLELSLDVADLKMTTSVVANDLRTPRALMEKPLTFEDGTSYRNTREMILFSGDFETHFKEFCDELDLMQTAYDTPGGLTEAERTLFDQLLPVDSVTGNKMTYNQLIDGIEKMAFTTDQLNQGVNLSNWQEKGIDPDKIRTRLLSGTTESRVCGISGVVANSHDGLANAEMKELAGNLLNREYRHMSDNDKTAGMTALTDNNGTKYTYSQLVAMYDKGGSDRDKVIDLVKENEMNKHQVRYQNGTGGYEANRAQGANRTDQAARYEYEYNRRQTGLAGLDNDVIVNGRPREYNIYTIRRGWLETAGAISKLFK